jgi:hypothetical protein
MIPLVVVLDLDGTIIGDITPQIVSWEICNDIKSSGGGNFYKPKDLYAKLQGGIIRPYFAEFIKSLKKNIPNIEFFIFTASEKKWAMNIIGYIEKACNIKFNRPLFTRQHCLLVDSEYKKCIKKISPTIMRSLKKKYNLNDVSQLNDQILIVENNDVYQANQRKYNVFCKTYDFKYPENIGAMFDQNEYKKHWQIINKYTSKYCGFASTSDFFKFQKNFYSYYILTVNQVESRNKIFNNDTFYKFLYKAIIYVVNTKRYNKFDERVIKYINNQLNINKNVHSVV